MGIHERAEEILALADYPSIGLAWQSHRTHARVGSGAVYLYVVLASTARSGVAWRTTYEVG